MHLRPPGFPGALGVGDIVTMRATEHSLFLIGCDPVFRSSGTVVPVLRARDVRHPPIGSVPTLETIHFEGPDARAHITYDDESILIPDVYTERPVEYRSAVGVRRAQIRVIVSDRNWVGRIHQIEHNQPVQIA